ncbi:hypothetical protein Tco_1386543 [Tanacetum coccineum]
MELLFAEVRSSGMHRRELYEQWNCWNVNSWMGVRGARSKHPMSGPFPFDSPDSQESMLSHRYSFFDLPSNLDPIDLRVFSIVRGIQQGSHEKLLLGDLPIKTKINTQTEFAAVYQVDLQAVLLPITLSHETGPTKDPYGSNEGL